jgi:ubiquinone/menaquinone biosynthesis C-methylase UbiE
MDEQQRKTLLRETFNTISGGYDNKALRFFSGSATHLATVLNLKGDEHVLDVATGTGHAALVLAACVRQGRVTGVDFSPGMLDQARKKAVLLNIRNVEFFERDMQNLGFSAHAFDTAVCAFGIFFAEDMDSTLVHIIDAVKPGGQIAVTAFQENYFRPLKDLMVNRLAGYGVQLPPQTWKRIATEAGCKELFRKAGLRDVRVEQRNMGYFLDNADEWWDVVWNAGLRRMVGQLSLSDQKRFRQEHMQEVAAIATREGIWLDVGVLFAIGKKA